MGSRITSFTHDGLTFDVIDEGPPEGDVVLMLHGFPERASCWAAVSERLHAQGYRTLAPDQRGYSPGARPPRRRDYAIQHLVDDVTALVDLVAKPVHVVAHDWGANVAWVFVGQHPEKVRTLTALSVPHPRAYLRSLLGPQLVKSWYFGFFMLPAVPERLAARPSGPVDQMLLRTGKTPQEVADFRTTIVDYGALPGALGWYRALPFAASTKMPDVTVPTTMLWSDGDTALSRQGIERTSSHVTGPYELVVLEGVTHWMPTQAPGEVGRVALERLATG